MRNFHEPNIHMGAWLREVREQRNLSQQDIGAQLSPPLNAIELDAYERGLYWISVDQLYQLGEILQIPVSYFLPHY